MDLALAVRVKAQVASFRRPLEHNYQRTLLMPPPTTLVGIAGAAMGLSDRRIWQEGALSWLKVAVLMDEVPCRAADLIKLMKFKGGEIESRSPYYRELLFNAGYTLIYGGPEECLYRLAKALESPAYALSLGREEDILLVRDLNLLELRKGDGLFSGTVIPGDLRGMRVEVKLEPGTKSEPVQVEVLPVKFELDERGVRSASELRSFTFLPIGLEVEVLGLDPFEVDGRSFAWLN